MRKYLDIPLTVVVTTVLTIAMLWPLEAPPPVPEGSDKLVHFIAFAALAFPLARTGRFGVIPVLIGASAFGAIIELIQPTFNRSAELSDWVADTLGVLVGIGLGVSARQAAPDLRGACPLSCAQILSVILAMAQVRDVRDRRQKPIYRATIKAQRR
jgi:VanZ family protein